MANKKKINPRNTIAADAVLGKKIKACRNAKKMSQQGLGALLGVSFQQIQKYENGQSRVSAARLQQMSAVFGIALSQLYGERGSVAADSVIAIDDAETRRMLRAYIKIGDVETQHRMVLLVEAIADRQS